MFELLELFESLLAVSAVYMAAALVLGEVRALGGVFKRHEQSAFAALVILLALASQVFSLELWGYRFDLRYATLAVACVFFGPWIGALSLAVIASLRLAQGGPGIEPAMAALALTYAAAVLQHLKLRPRQQSPGLPQAALTGAVAAVMPVFALPLLPAAVIPAFATGPLPVAAAVNGAMGMVLALLLRYGLERASRFEAARVDAAAARAASEAKSRFLGVMSHELRTPLNAIQGFAQLIRRTEEPEKVQSYAGLIETSGAQMLELVNELLDVSALEAGRAALHPRPFKPAEAAGRAVQLAAGQSARHRLRLELDPPAELEGLSVVGDGGRFQQVAVNYLMNAIRHADPGEVVLRLAAQPQPDGRVRLRLAVSDPGPGLGARERERVFQAFTQAGRGETGDAGGLGQSTPGGVGLGLYIVRQSAELMGGRVGVESREGQPSTFWFELTLPVAGPVAMARSAAACRGGAAA